MAKVIKEYGAVRCLAAEPVNEEKALTWEGWRQNYIGLEGWLNLCESEHKQPGKQFFYFFGGDESEKDWYLRSYYKQIDERQNKTLVFVTENSRYKFEILHKE